MNQPKTHSPARLLLGATGGTIATPRGEHQPRNARQLADLVMNADSFRRFSLDPLDFFHLDSSAVEIDHILTMIRRMGELLDDSHAGVVITHGTDMMEETAFLWDLFWDRPVTAVLTGAMRSAYTPGEDGPRNLLAACLTAAHPEAASQGPLLVMHDEIFRAGEVTKLHTYRVDSFHSDHGPIGLMDADFTIHMHRKAARTPTYSLPSSLGPPLPILTAAMSEDGRWIDSCVAAGIPGLVVAAAGRKGIPSAMGKALQRAIDANVLVVGASRCPLGDTDLGIGRNDILWAGSLNPIKARLLLMTGLTLYGSDVAQIEGMFRAFHG